MTNTLIAKITKASIAVGALATDRTNEAQKYAYISADKILERAGDALAKVGIAILPSIINEAITQVDYTDSYGKARIRFDASVEFSMLVTDGENELTMLWRGRGNDFAVPDKAMYKAITSGHKYFIMKLLNIGVGNEDGEHEVYQAAQDAAKPSHKPADNPFDAKAIKLATAAQIAEIGRLGVHVYGDEWKAEQEPVSLWASQGARTSLVDLHEIEAAKLIRGLEKKAKGIIKREVAA